MSEHHRCTEASRKRIDDFRTRCVTCGAIKYKISVKDPAFGRNLLVLSGYAVAWIGLLYGVGLFTSSQPDMSPLNVLGVFLFLGAMCLGGFVLFVPMLFGDWSPVVQLSAADSLGALLRFFGLRIAAGVTVSVGLCGILTVLSMLAGWGPPSLGTLMQASVLCFFLGFFFGNILGR